jgi:hypothetical protein
MGSIERLLAAWDGGVLVWGSLGLSVILVALCWSKLRSDHKLADPLGEVEWSFTDSWASMLTAVGALLGTILATSGILPMNAEPLSSNALTGLNLFFGALVVIAPLIFSAVQMVQPPVKDDEGPRYKGFVWGFLLACLLTIWGVLGELGTLFLLLREVEAGFFNEPVMWLFAAVLFAAIVAVFVYSANRILATISWKPAEGLVADTTPARRWRLL